MTIPPFLSDHCPKKPHEYWKLMPLVQMIHFRNPRWVPFWKTVNQWVARLKQMDMVTIFPTPPNKSKSPYRCIWIYIKLELNMYESRVHGRHQPYQPHTCKFPTICFHHPWCCVQVFNRSVNSSFIVMEEALDRRKVGKLQQEAGWMTCFLPKRSGWSIGIYKLT